MERGGNEREARLLVRERMVILCLRERGGETPLPRPPLLENRNCRALPPSLLERGGGEQREKDGKVIVSAPPLLKSRGGEPLPPLSWRGEEVRSEREVGKLPSLYLLS